MGNLCVNGDSQITRDAFDGKGQILDAQRRSPRFNYNEPRLDRKHAGYERETSASKQQRSRDSSSNNKQTTAGSMYGGSHQHQWLQDIRQQQRVSTKYTYGNGDHYDGEVLAERRDIRDGYGVFYCSNKQKRTNYEYHGQWR